MGPYLLLNQIGKGTYAKVFKSKIEKTGQIVAVKMIPTAKLSEKAKLRV